MFDMVSGLSGDLVGLAAEDAQRLATVLERRNDYLGLQQQANRLRIKVLETRTAAAQQELNEYLSGAIASARARMTEDLVKLLDSAINIDGIKSLLPMMLLGIVQNINLPLLLTTLGLDPDMISELVKQAKRYTSGESDSLS